MVEARRVLVEKRGLRPDSNTISEARVSRRTTFSAEIKARLDFLIFAVRNSELHFSFNHLDALWAALVDGAISPRERESLFQWLSGLLPAQDLKAAIQWSVIGRLFHERLECLFSVAVVEIEGGGGGGGGGELMSMGLMEFKCFEVYFKYVNGHAGEEEKLSQKKQDGLFLVHDENLHGIEQLWSIALGVNDGAGEIYISFVSYD